MVVHADGSTVGTIGGGKVEDSIRLDALEALHRNAPVLRRYALQNPERGDPGVCGGTMTVYLEPYMTPPTVFVIGVGHVGRAVVDLAHWLGYRTVVVDERAEMVTAEAVPQADVRFAGTVADALAAHPITEDTSVVVVTRSHDLDAQITPLLLETPAQVHRCDGQQTPLGGDQAGPRRFRLPAGTLGRDPPSHRARHRGGDHRGDRGVDLVRGHRGEPPRRLVTLFSDTSSSCEVAGTSGPGSSGGFDGWGSPSSSWSSRGR